MAVNQQVQDLFNQGTQAGNKGIFDLVQSGQVSLQDVANTIGQDKVDWYLSQNNLNLGGTQPAAPATPTAPTATTPTTTPVAPKPATAGPSATGGVLLMSDGTTRNMSGNNPTSGNLGTLPSTTGQENLQSNFNPTRYPTPIPQQPQYWNAATSQGAENLNAARQTVALSNPDINTAFGSQTVSVGPDGRPVINQTLTPEQQARLDSLETILPGLTDQIRTITGNRVGWNVTQNVDAPTVGGTQSLADALRKREQPRMDRRRSQLQSDLIARGFNPQDEAYKAAMDELVRAENDFDLGLISQAGQEQSRLFNLQSALRGQQTNEEALMRTLPIQTYAQLVQAMTPTMPNFQPYQGAQVEAAPYFNAVNAEGLFNLGRYGTMIQGELGTRGIDATKGAATTQAITNLAGAFI